jgi:hypothetical protein
MNRFRKAAWGLAVVALLAAAAPVAAQPEGVESPHEVWVIDQSDSTPDGGGWLYIYSGAALVGADPESTQPELFDLGGDARDVCMAQTGTAPRRPHMLLFNADHTHGILTFVATGHVLFIDAASRAALACVDVGMQAHAAFPSDDQRYVVVANQNGKLLQRIQSDYASNSFTLDATATIDLAACTTPSGAACQDPALRPDNAPICPIIDSSSRFTFVTLRGGGMFVVDTTTTPMQIVAEYDRATVHPNGCGGLETGGKMYINAGGGTPANPNESDLYMFRLDSFSGAPSAPNTPAPRLVFSQDDQGYVDSHGAILTQRDRYLWLSDRAANKIVIVDTESDTLAGEIDLSDGGLVDTAPDLLDVSPGRTRVYMTLRGPEPLTANAPGVNNAVGLIPGLGIVVPQDGGRTGAFHATLRISNEIDGLQKADPHGIRVRHIR